MRRFMSFTVIAGLAAMLAWLGPDRAAAQTRTALDIYVIDVEGGNATLFVTPSGESLLIDTGNVAPEPRSAMPSASWRPSRTPG